MERKYNKSPSFKKILDELGLGEFWEIVPSATFITDVSGINTSSNFPKRCRENPKWARTVILGVIANHCKLTRDELELILATRKVESRLKEERGSGSKAC